MAVDGTVSSYLVTEADKNPRSSLKGFYFFREITSSHMACDRRAAGFSLPDLTGSYIMLTSHIWLFLPEHGRSPRPTLMLIGIGNPTQPACSMRLSTWVCSQSR